MITSKKLVSLLFWLIVDIATGFPVLLGQSASIQAEGDPAIAKVIREFQHKLSCNSGMSIYDVQKGQWIFRYRDEDFFLPASNVKILTLYAALLSLPPKMDAAYGLYAGDSLFIWGGGDPGTRYPSIDSSCALLDLLRSTDKKIVFSNQHFQTTRYGKGWAWDDHSFSFQTERNAFPIYGNRLWIDRYRDSVVVTPHYFSSLVEAVQDTVADLDKSEWGDAYYYHYQPEKKEEHKTIPITFFKNDLRFIWTEAVGKPILLLDKPLDTRAFHMEGSTRDTLLRIMMQESDNFIAEQLLLAGSLSWLKVMDEERMIDTLIHGPMRFMLDSIQWMDGSGLSRYNLMTPNTVVRVLSKIYDRQGMPFIQNIFAAGGKNGSLKRWALSKGGRPFVYAKTGSMRNVLNLSGYLITRKGKVFIFSWMNDQCMDKSGDIRSAMEKVLNFLYEEY